MVPCSAVASLSSSATDGAPTLFASSRSRAAVSGETTSDARFTSFAIITPPRSPRTRRHGRTGPAAPAERRTTAERSGRGGTAPTSARPRYAADPDRRPRCHRRTSSSTPTRLAQVGTGSIDGVTGTSAQTVASRTPTADTPRPPTVEPPSQLTDPRQRSSILIPSHRCCTSSTPATAAPTPPHVRSFDRWRGPATGSTRRRRAVISPDAARLASSALISTTNRSSLALSQVDT